MSEHRAFLDKPVDVRFAVPHDSGTDVEPADVVSHDEENAGLLCSRLLGHHSLEYGRGKILLV